MNSLRLAWQFSRGNRGRWFFLSFTISLGIAGLIATQGFGKNLRQAVEDQAKTLLGADLVISSNRPFTEDQQNLFKEVQGESSAIASFASMAYFPSQEQSRLARVRAIEGGFPYYGALETDPPQGLSLLDRDLPSALVDQSLMSQFGLSIGEQVKIGNQTFEIAGSIIKIPGESPTASAVGPRIYIRHQYLEETRLIQFGSRIRYRIAWQTMPSFNPDEWVGTHREKLSGERLSFETVEDRKRTLGDAFQNLERFLGLIGLAALIMGGIGLATSMHQFAIKAEHLVAVLRCLGAKSGKSMAVPLWIGSGLALVGSSIGVLIGVLFQAILPMVFKDFLPIDLTFTIQWQPILWILPFCFVLGLGFVCLPLSRVWVASPLSLFQSISIEAKGKTVRRVVISGLAGIGLIFCWLLNKNLFLGVFIPLCILLVLAIFWGLSKALLKLTKLGPKRWLSPLSQLALSNLSRPQNHAVLVLMTLGLLGFLVMNHYLVHRSLVSQFDRQMSGERPDLILFDIQPDQTKDLEQIQTAYDIQAQPMIPMVTMRIESIEQEPIRSLVGEGEEKIPEWAALWEYRSTYRDSLSETESLEQGKWVGHWDQTDPIPISLEESIAENLKVGVGSQMTFDIQGVPMTCSVASIRKVDWQSMKPNFYILFPAGVLEEAPQMFIQAARLNRDQRDKAFQQDLFEAFPNISSVDLALVWKTLDDIIGKATFAIRFMAMFFIVTSLLVLTSSLFNLKDLRNADLLVLKAIGARNGQLKSLMVLELGILAFLASFLALTLSSLSAFLLTRFALNVDFVYDWRLIPTALASALALVVTMGLSGLALNRRGSFLEALRTTSR